MEITLDNGKIKIVDDKTYLFYAKDIKAIKPRLDSGYFIIQINRAGVKPNIKVSQSDVTIPTSTSAQDLYDKFIALTNDSIERDIIPAKKYVALLTQTGEADPVVNVLTNNVGLVEVTREGVGIYRLTTSGLLTASKTVPVNEPSLVDADGNTITMTLNGEDYYEIQTKDDSDTLADGILDNQYVSFEVYSA